MTKSTSNLILCLFCFFAFNCFAQQTTSAEPVLKQRLDAAKAEWESKTSAEKKQIYDEGIQAIRESGILESAIQVGDTAPDFILKNAENLDVSLYSYLEKGPVVLIWYRGGWCPYCNITMHQLQQELPAFKAEGANLIALTPELPDQSISTAEKHDLEFEVLSDTGNVVGHKYGIVYDLTTEVAAIYIESFNLHDHNDNTSNQLPLAATYVIGKDGVVRYAFLDAEYRNRAEPSEILKALKMMK